MLIKEKKDKLMPKNKLIYVWCWFVMFASEASHASSYEFLALRVTGAANDKCTNRINALGSDDANFKKKRNRQKHVLQIKRNTI